MSVCPNCGTEQSRAAITHVGSFQRQDDGAWIAQGWGFSLPQERPPSLLGWAPEDLEEFATILGPRG